MELAYETQGNNTFLVCKTDSKDVMDSSVLGMLTNNKINGLAQPVFSQFDDVCKLKYDVTSKITARKIFDGTVKKKRLLDIFSGIMWAVSMAEDYMIDSSNLMISLDYIFVDIANNNIELICIPLNIETQSTDLATFFKGILFNAQYDQSENTEYVAKMISCFNNNASFSMTAFMDVVHQLMKEPQKVSSKEPKSISPEIKAPASAEPVISKANVQNDIPQSPQSIPQAPQSVPRTVKPIPEQIATIPKSQPTETAPEKKMSLFYLLNHYTTENKAIYDAQKKVNKGGVKEKPVKQVQKKQSVKPSPQGFAIPGQDAPQIVSPVISHGSEVAAPVHNFEQYQRVPAVAPAGVAVLDKKPSAELDFGDTNYAFDESDTDSGTQILGQETPAQKLSPQLIRRKNNERIPISKSVFRMGRDSEFSDYAIANNNFIGHSHCHIIIRDGEYFVVDDNSRNHTFVDGVMISSGNEVKISHGQIIKLADEEFEFRLY